MGKLNNLRLSFLRQGTMCIGDRAYTDCTAIGVCDFVVIAAKSTANHTLPDFIKSLIGQNTVLLTLQNGMGNCETFASIIPAERIVAGL